MVIIFFFFFNDTATTEIYTLSLHDALPISGQFTQREIVDLTMAVIAINAWNRLAVPFRRDVGRDRKSTRLNSSHANISYAVFCLKKKTPTEFSQLSCCLLSPYSSLVMLPAW